MLASAIDVWLFVVLLCGSVLLKTVVIQIGNSDSKLTRSDWLLFIADTRQSVAKHCGQVHFDGGSSFDSQWQNVCIVAESRVENEASLLIDLRRIRQKWKQYAIAVTLGETAMV